jgi:hypothetical protein
VSAATRWDLGDNPAVTADVGLPALLRLVFPPSALKGAVESLSLSGCSGLRDAGVTALSARLSVDPARSANLLRLSLADTGITRAGAGQLAALLCGSALPQLRALNLSSNALGTSGVMPVVRAVVDRRSAGTASVRIAALNLAATGFDDGCADALRELVESDAVPDELSISGNGLVTDRTILCLSQFFAPRAAGSGHEADTVRPQLRLEIEDLPLTSGDAIRYLIERTVELDTGAVERRHPVSLLAVGSGPLGFEQLETVALCIVAATHTPALSELAFTVPEGDQAAISLLEDAVARLDRLRGLEVHLAWPAVGHMRTTTLWSASRLQS